MCFGEQHSTARRRWLTCRIASRPCLTTSPQTDMSSICPMSWLCQMNSSATIVVAMPTSSYFQHMFIGRWTTHQHQHHSRRTCSSEQFSIKDNVMNQSRQTLLITHRSGCAQHPTGTVNTNSAMDATIVTSASPQRHSCSDSPHQVQSDCLPVCSRSCPQARDRMWRDSL